MKILSNIITVITVIVLLNACTPATFQKIQTPKPLQNEITVIVPKDKENKTIWIKNNANTLNDSLEVKYKKIAETFYATAIYGKQKGYLYFAITAKNMNNLSGFPINNFDNIVAFCDYEKKTGKKYYRPRPICWAESGGLFDLHTVKLQVEYFKNPIPGLFLYNINDTIKQTNKMLF